MKYLLIENRGILLLTKPEQISGDLVVEIQNSPENAVVVLSINENTIYRKVKDGFCSFPSNIIKDGLAKITVTSSDNSKIWKCDDFIITNEVIISDNSVIRNIVNNIQIQLEALLRKNESLSKELIELKKDYQKIVGGYDVD